MHEIGLTPGNIDSEIILKHISSRYNLTDMIILEIGYDKIEKFKEKLMPAMELIRYDTMSRYMMIETTKILNYFDTSEATLRKANEAYHALYKDFYGITK